jgi:hypothetical protein
MGRPSPTFGVELSNVPIVNLRWEFRTHFALARDRKLLPFRGGKRLFRARYFVWLADVESGVSLLVLRTLLGVEAYMSFAAEFGGAERGLLDAKFKSACRNPFSMGCKGTANCYYNHLPRLIDTKLAMADSRPASWITTKALYSEIRNPLMHGEELRNVTEDNLLRLFDSIADIYRWIDDWFDPEPSLGSGARRSLAFE